MAAHRDEIVRIVRSHGGLRVHVFGSAAKEDDPVDSDLDLLVGFGAGTLFHQIFALDDELAAVTGVPIDVMSARIATAEILATAVEL